ncbi:MAG: GGDEF domain-containing protein [Bdellovibrionales bacterium]
MAERVVFLIDERENREPTSSLLRLKGYDVIETDKLTVVETELDHPSFSLLVYAGDGGESLEICQKLAARSTQVPILYILDKKQNTVAIEDHRQCLGSTCSERELLENVHILTRMGRLHRRIHQLSQLASGSTAVDQMFTKLDIHHILDRVLSYFGARVEVENLHWIRWTDLPHMLQTERKVLSLEMEVFEARSPRVMSLHQMEMNHLFKLLSSSLYTHELSEKAQLSHWTAKVDGQGLLYVPVQSLNGGVPLGLLLFEGTELTEQENLGPHITESLRLMARYIEFGLSHWDSKTLAMTDDLTDLYNQRYLPVVLDNEINRAQRRRSEFSVLFMDLDYFKAVNDTKGHWIGSKLLKEVSEILKRCIRSCDFGFRYGGDEFVVILPDTNIQGGQIVAERIRHAIETTHFLIDGHDMRLTVSVGLAGYPHHALTREDIIQLADQAMYYGKRKSRNIVYVAS